MGTEGGVLWVWLAPGEELGVGILGTGPPELQS